jgi:hypothetical protein
MCYLAIGTPTQRADRPSRPTSHNFNDSDSDQWLRQPECDLDREPDRNPFPSSADRGHEDRVLRARDDRASGSRGDQHSHSWRPRFGRIVLAVFAPRSERIVHAKMGCQLVGQADGTVHALTRCLQGSRGRLGVRLATAASGGSVAIWRSGRASLLPPCYSNSAPCKPHKGPLLTDLRWNC